MTVLIIVQTVILIVLCVLVTGLLRAYATVLRRLHRLDGGDPEQRPARPGGRDVDPAGFRTVDGVQPLPDPVLPGVTGGRGGGGVDRAGWPSAHDIVGVGLAGEVITARTVGVRHDTVLVFLSSGCTGCDGFWRQFADPAALPDLGGRTLVITKGPESESIGALGEKASPGVDVVMSSEAWSDYGVPGSPYVIVVDGPSGRVKGEGSGTSLSQVSGLIRLSIGDAAGMRSVRKPRPDAEREVEVDRALLAAGIAPGHPSLYGGAP